MIMNKPCEAKKVIKPKTVYICRECSYESPKWLGRCPECASWNTLEEASSRLGTAGGARFGPRPAGGSGKVAKAVRLVDVSADEAGRIRTGIGEFDRTLGGGIVSGSAVLVAGDPGVGKSTLLLSACERLARAGAKAPILYVSGEESPAQVRSRANRLGVSAPDLMFLAETDLGAIISAILELRPAVAVVDSIQTVTVQGVPGAPGSVTQVREAASALVRTGKSGGTAVILVGHVTKSGAIAGPMLLEHLVDTVLYFDDAGPHSLRILRAAKNRFGSTNEIGVFSMAESGLEEVANPSEVFLAQRAAGIPGTAVTAALEGSRPILVEVQALLGRTAYGPSARRTATGVDFNRLCIILAVLERRVGVALGDVDVYVNVAGGVRIEEPAADLAVALAVASAARNAPLATDLVVTGEIGLAGEVRAIAAPERRIAESARVGFRRALVPAASLASRSGRSLQREEGMEVIGVRTVTEALAAALEVRR